MVICGNIYMYICVYFVSMVGHWFAEASLWCIALEAWYNCIAWMESLWLTVTPIIPDHWLCWVELMGVWAQQHQEGHCCIVLCNNWFYCIMYCWHCLPSFSRGFVVTFSDFKEDTFVIQRFKSSKVCTKKSNDFAIMIIYAKKICRAITIASDALHRPSSHRLWLRKNSCCLDCTTRLQVWETIRWTCSLRHNRK